MRRGSESFHTSQTQGLLVRGKMTLRLENKYPALVRQKGTHKVQDTPIAAVVGTTSLSLESGSPQDATTLREDSISQPRRVQAGQHSNPFRLPQSATQHLEGQQLMLAPIFILGHGIREYQITGTGTVAFYEMGKGSVFV